MEKMALKVAGTVFLVVAILHLLRVLWKVEVIIGGFAAPLWYSTVGFIFAFLLSVYMFKSAK